MGPKIRRRPLLLLILSGLICVLLSTALIVLQSKSLNFSPEQHGVDAKHGVYAKHGADAKHHESQGSVTLDNCPRIALLFLTVKGLLQRDLWEEWLNLAYEEEQLFGNSAIPGYTNISNYFPPLAPLSHTIMKRHEMINPRLSPGSLPTDPLFEFAPPRRCGNVPQRASVYSMMIGARNPTEAVENLPKAFPNAPFNCSLVAAPPTAHMQSSSGMLRLYSEALQDPRNYYFVVISESTIPVITFGELYDYLMLANRSLVQPATLEFSSLTYKHTQWTILNRPHTELLVNDRQNTSTMGTLSYRGAFSGEEEIRETVELALDLGKSRLWQEVNGGDDMRPLVSLKRGIKSENFQYSYRTLYWRPIPAELFHRPVADFWPDMRITPDFYSAFQPKGLQVASGSFPRKIVGMDELEFSKWLINQAQMISMIRKVDKDASCLDRHGKNVTISECMISHLNQEQRLRNKYNIR